MTNKEFAERLTKLAAIYGSSDDIPQLYNLTESTEFIFCSGKEDFAKAVKAFGSGKKGSEDSYIYFTPDLFPNLRIAAFKTAVCERVVVEKKFVPETVLPAREEQTIPAHEIEIVEWRCKPFTKAEEVTA